VLRTADGLDPIASVDIALPYTYKLGARRARDTVVHLEVRTCPCNNCELDRAAENIQHGSMMVQEYTFLKRYRVDGPVNDLLS
jgi:hypothetical protein